MHISTVLLLGGMLGAVAADCNHDNCLRAVLASAFPTRAGLADCQSYFLDTVTPATVTTTHTSTTTSTRSSTTDIIGKLRRRDGHFFDARQATVIPSNIPAYASACSGSARYSSACLCAGAVPITTVVATPTKTVSSVVTTATSKLVTDVYGLLPTCYSDNAQNGEQYRILTGKSEGPVADMTNEKCATFCNGFTYFGTEYSTYCFCGNTLQPGQASNPNLPDPGACTYTCGGNPNEHCGGFYAISIYTLIGTLP